jgi:hypothetical protein
MDRLDNLYLACPCRGLPGQWIACDPAGRVVLVRVPPVFSPRFGQRIVATRFSDRVEAVATGVSLL